MSGGDLSPVSYTHLLGVAGDFDSAKMEARLREAFAAWPRGQSASGPSIKPEPAKPGYYQVDKTDVNQSHIQMVALGITRKNPDYLDVYKRQPS